MRTAQHVTAAGAVLEKNIGGGSMPKSWRPFLSRRPQNTHAKQTPHSPHCAKWTTPTSKNAFFTAAVTNIWEDKAQVWGELPPLLPLKRRTVPGLQTRPYWSQHQTSGHTC